MYANVASFMPIKDPCTTTRHTIAAKVQRSHVLIVRIVHGSEATSRSTYITFMEVSPQNTDWNTITLSRGGGFWSGYKLNCCYTLAKCVVCFVFYSKNIKWSYPNHIYTNLFPKFLFIYFKLNLIFASLNMP